MGIQSSTAPFRARHAVMVAALLTVTVPGAVLAAVPRPVSSAGVTHLPRIAQRAGQHERALPARNIAPKPNFFDVCATKGYDDAGCITEVLAAIRHARAPEKMTKHRMVLPRNFTKLSVAEQTFVVTDLERVDRGLRPFQGMSTVLDRAAKAAATMRVDATLVTPVVRTLHIGAYGSNWASDFGPLSADYNWMYNDGYSRHGGVNLACQKPGAAGCWGHRRNILWPYTQPRLIAGTGTGRPAGASIAEIFGGASGRTPRFAYTWKQALRHGANGHRAR